MIIQLCDQEEIMRVHDKGIAIRTVVEMCQDFGMNFKLIKCDAVFVPIMYQFCTK